ncbi:MAG: glycosyltransferase, partial [bacterium]|nr:glycosyltransferase [bacterium]
EDFVITCQDPFETGYVGRRLSKKFNLPLHLQVHTDFLNPYFRKGVFLNKIRVYMAKKILPYSSGIRTVSERIKNSLAQDPKLRILESRIKTLPIFVDTKKMQDTPVSTDLHKKYPQFNFIALSLSRLSEEKNIQLAIKAFFETIKKYPRAGLVIVGSGPQRRILKLAVLKLGMKNNVVFEEWTDDPVSYYKTANLFLQTSFYEGYGLALAEAISAGCPAISTDAGIAPELLSGARVSVICGLSDAECFSKGIAWFIEDNSLREEIVQNGQKNLKSFNPSSKEEYLKMYREGLEIAVNTWYSFNK